MILCDKAETFTDGLLVHPAVMFLNSNKSETNIHRLLQENRQKCILNGIVLGKEYILNKEPDRDIDREAVNQLVLLLITGQYDTVVVENLTDITEDADDLKEFMWDAETIGVGFFELSTMQYYGYEETEHHRNKKRNMAGRQSMKIRRGDILYADLGVQYQGSMQGGLRPVVVVSNNKANKYSTVITVVPLSTKIYKKRSLPTHVFVSAYQAEGLEQHSIALCEQVTALNSGRIIDYIGNVGEEILAGITKAVQVQVGAFDQYN